MIHETEDFIFFPENDFLIKVISITRDESHETGKIKDIKHLLTLVGLLKCCLTAGMCFQSILSFHYTGDGVCADLILRFCKVNAVINLPSNLHE